MTLQNGFRNVRILTAIVLLILVWLPWHRVSAGEMVGGLGPDNNVAVKYVNPATHRGIEVWPISLGGPIVILSGVLAERRVKRKLSVGWGVLWSTFLGLLPSAALVLFMMETLGLHGCDKVERLPAEHTYLGTLVGAAGLGVVAMIAAIVVGVRKR